MKFAYLIMANGDLSVLEKNILKLDNEYNDFFIHIDKKNNEFDNFVSRMQNKVKKSQIIFIDRNDLRWGDYSLVKCELMLLREATKNKYDYYHLMSESDMVIKDNDYIQDFFKKNKGYEFVDFRTNPRGKFWEYRYRGINLFRRNQKNNNKILNYTAKIINKSFLLFQYLIKYDYTKKSGFEIKYGSQWFSITHELAKFIVNFEGEIERTFKYGSCVDEHFLQTIIYNSSFKDKIYDGGNLRFILWDKNTNSPKVITYDNYDLIKNSKCIFARKFNYKIDKKIIEVILKRGML